MSGTDVVDAGLNGAEAINQVLGNEETIFQIAIFIAIVIGLRMLFKYFVDNKKSDKDIEQVDAELIQTLAERGFDADGNRIDGFAEGEQALFERRDTSDRSRIRSRRISSRHYSGGGAYEGSRRNYENDSEDNGDE